MDENYEFCGNPIRAITIQKGNILSGILYTIYVSLEDT